MRKKGISRRHFLKRAAVAGAAAFSQYLWRGKAPPAQAAEVEEASPVPTGPSTTLLPCAIYLPLVLNSPALPHGPSKLGLHTILSNKAAAFCQAVHEAGAYVAVVKALDNFAYARKVKKYSPETVTVGRCSGLQWVEPTGDPALKARQVLEEHMKRWVYEKDVIDYWEVLNENDPPGVEGHVWLARFYMAAMDIAEENGYKLALFSYSAGVPEWYEWEAIVETGVFARAKAGGHIVSLHEYNWPVMSYRWGEQMPGCPVYEDRGVLTGRYRYLYRDFLIPRDEVVPLVIGECGLDPVLWQPGQPTNHWKERFVAEMAWYDERLREDDYVIGAAMFTIGGSGAWSSYDYEELLWPGNPYGTSFFEHIVSLKDG